ncbi:D-aminoacylase, partial [archaeon]
ATGRDTATYETPAQPAKGIVAVFVNGALTWNDGAHTGARGGHVVMRRGASAP